MVVFVSRKDAKFHAKRYTEPVEVRLWNALGSYSFLVFFTRSFFF